MKRVMISAALMIGLLASPTTMSQEIPAVPVNQTESLSTVAKALSEIPAVCGSFNKDADYFIYLYSASWCGPCRRIMPEIAKFYKNNLSKEKRIEIILCNADISENEAKKYVEHYGVDFYTVMSRDNSAVAKLPGAYRVRSIPHCIAVDKNGNRIFSGHASTLFTNLNKLK